MKNILKITFISVFFSGVLLNSTSAQWDPGGANTTTSYLYRSGAVGIGPLSNGFGNRLHIKSTDDRLLRLQNYNSSGGSSINSKVAIDFLTYNTSASPNASSARIEVIDMGNYRSSMAFLTKRTSTVDGSDVTEHLRINPFGWIGQGTANPTARYHLYAANDSTTIRRTYNRWEWAGNSNFQLDIFGDSHANRPGWVQFGGWGTDVKIGLVADAQPNVESGTTLKGLFLNPNATTGALIGIGTTTPTSVLHLQSSSTNLLKLQTTSSTNAGLDFLTYTTTAAAARVARIQANDMNDWNGSLSFLTKGDGIQDGGAVTEKMRITQDGKVGIGTINPQAPLEVANQGAANLALNSTNAGSSNSSSVKFQNNGTTAGSIDYSTFAACGSGGLHLGIISVPVTDKKIHIYSNRIIFGNNSVYGTCGATGLNNTYSFDADLGATAILVAPPGGPSPGTIPSIPSGYIFSVNAGNANFGGRLRVMTTSFTPPDNNLGGLTISNTSGVGAYSWIQTQQSMPLALNPVPNVNPGTSNTSYVAIGFTPGTYTVPNNFKLAVKGNIICEELKVQYASMWADFVFDKSYKLKPLEEVESFIKENKHLPDVPSAEDVAKNGIESGKMDATLLQKIEELTLYMIEQKKQMDTQNAELQKLKEQNEILIQKLK